MLGGLTPSCSRHHTSINPGGSFGGQAGQGSCRNSGRSLSLFLFAKLVRAEQAPRAASAVCQPWPWHRECLAPQPSLAGQAGVWPRGGCSPLSCCLQGYS